MRRNLASYRWWIFLAAALPFPLRASPAVPPYNQPALVVRLNAERFEHTVGRRGGRGWEADYRRDKPGYVFHRLTSPVLLEDGLYRATFAIRRGLYPRRGLLREAFGLFRIEIWDVTTNELLVQRELQTADFGSPNQYEPRWIEFSMQDRAGHAVEPRVFWFGIANGEVESVEISKFPTVDETALAAKAQRLGELMEREFIENGFVVSRNLDGTPDDTGDATTYTGFYAAALAWKAAETRDAMTIQALENAVQALHRAIKGTPERPVITRYVDADGVPYPNDPSKDMYMSFFFGYAAAYPQIRNEALRAQMRADMERIGNRLLKDGLRVRVGTQAVLSLTPHLTQEEITEGVRKMLRRKKLQRSVLKGMRAARRYIAFGEIFPTASELEAAVRSGDEARIIRLVIPTLNGVFGVLERGRDILREKYREDLFPRRTFNREYPGRKLTFLLADALARFPKNREGQRFRRLSDMNVLGGNALISLHIVRSALLATGRPQFLEYYRTNLFTQDALLKAAMEWYGFDEDLVRVTSGNATADRARRGYLTLLSLWSLASRETNPFMKEKYMTLLARAWHYERHEDNPLSRAMWMHMTGRTADAPFILRALDEFPEDRLGYGEEYWKAHGEQIAKKWAGGAHEGYAREPLPWALRPKDAFLCQRSARRLRGDRVMKYPPTDFLFVYWFARHHGLIAAPAVKPIAATSEPR